MQIMLLNLIFLILIYFSSFILINGQRTRPKETSEYLQIDLTLGKKFGLEPNSSIPNDVLRRVEQGAANGNRDNIYFLGLLRLYGIELTKNEAGAANEFRRAADLGLPEAMTAYGMCAYLGLGMETDETLAVKWFRRAIAVKDINGYWMLAKMLLEGSAGPPNYAEAVAYFTIAAQEHIPQAEHHLGIMYEYGLGVEENFEKAADWYRRATEKQYLESMYHLGLMYSHGRPGFQQDFHLAFPLFEAGARSGHGPSQYMLGIFFAFGYGFEPEYTTAIKWFERAVGSGDDRILDKATNAAQELIDFMAEAHKVNEEIMNKYQQQANQYDDEEDEDEDEEDDIDIEDDEF